MPPRPEELPPGLEMGDTYGGALYVGNKGKILCGSHGANGLRIWPEKRMEEYQRPARTLPRSTGPIEMAGVFNRILRIELILKFF